MRLTGLFIAALVLSSCTIPSSVDKSTAESIASRLSYVQDVRTEQCFATISSSTYMGYQVVSITSVPCTPEVMAQVRQ